LLAVRLSRSCKRPRRSRSPGRKRMQCVRAAVIQPPQRKLAHSPFARSPGLPCARRGQAQRIPLRSGTPTSRGPGAGASYGALFGPVVVNAMGAATNLVRATRRSLEGSGALVLTNHALVMRSERTPAVRASAAHPSVFSEQEGIRSACWGCSGCMPALARLPPP